MSLRQHPTPIIMTYTTAFIFFILFSILGQCKEMFSLDNSQRVSIYELSGSGKNDRLVIDFWKNKKSLKSGSTYDSNHKLKGYLLHYIHMNGGLMVHRTKDINSFSGVTLRGEKLTFNELKKEIERRKNLQNLLKIEQLNIIPQKQVAEKM